MVGSAATLLFLLPLLAGTATTGSSSSSPLCPASCYCKWRRGKDTVDCKEKGMDRIPIMRRDAGTQVLNMGGNPLVSVPDDAFTSSNLLNLQEVILAGCDIDLVSPHAFRRLINLVDLDLSDNELTAVPSAAFADVPQLRELKLSGNPIATVSDGAFSSLSALVRLEMSRCDVLSLGAGAFSGLSHLQWLRLDGNLLAHLSPAPLLPLRTLHGLDLHGNPFNCTCALRPLREWMLGSNVPSTIPPACAGPQHLRGRAWDSIEIREFSCLPRILTVGTREAAVAANEEADGAGEVANNVTLYCRAEGSALPSISWSWQGQVIKNGSLSSVGSAVFIVTGGDSGGGSNGLTATSELHVVNADLDHGGEYFCHASNPAGEDVRSVRLTLAKPVVTTTLDHHQENSRRHHQQKVGHSQIYVIAAYGGCAVIFLTLFFVCCVYSVRQKPAGSGGLSAGVVVSVKQQQRRRHVLEQRDRDDGPGEGEFQVEKSGDGKVEGQSVEELKENCQKDSKVDSSDDGVGLVESAKKEGSAVVARAKSKAARPSNLLQQSFFTRQNAITGEDEEDGSVTDISQAGRERRQKMVAASAASSSFSSKEGVLTATTATTSGSSTVALSTSVESLQKLTSSTSFEEKKRKKAASTVLVTSSGTSTISPRVRFNLKPTTHGDGSGAEVFPLLRPLRLRSPSDPMVAFLDEKHIEQERPTQPQPAAPATTTCVRRVRFGKRSTSAEHDFAYPAHTCNGEQQQARVRRSRTQQGSVGGGGGSHRGKRTTGRSGEEVEEEEEEYRMWSEKMLIRCSSSSGTRSKSSSGTNRRTFPVIVDGRTSLPERGGRRPMGREFWSSSTTTTQSRSFQHHSFYPPPPYDASESDVTTSSSADHQQQQQYQQQRHNGSSRVPSSWRHSLNLPLEPQQQGHHAAGRLPSSQSFEYHSAQLERFLREYRDLQVHLVRMREACDGMKQAGLRRDLEELRTAILELEARCGDDDDGGKADRSASSVSRSQVAELRRRFETISRSLDAGGGGDALAFAAAPGAVKPILKQGAVRSASRERSGGAARSMMV